MAETRPNPGDSYIGSLISLTSKSEIRYEGLLYTVDTENSNIALQNVRSFGTEGRKQNGPQIPASDKVYEFIIFRGTDIKDLQVKMSPTPPSIHNDPAIISLQQASQPSQPVSAPPPPYAPVADLMGNASSTYKASSVPYYLTGNSNVPVWAPPPPPPGPSRSMPAYWQGYYRPQEEHRLLQPFVAPALPLAPPPLAQAMAAPSAASVSAPALAPAPATATPGPQKLATLGMDPPPTNSSPSSSSQTPSHTPLLPALTSLGISSVPDIGFSMPLAGSSSFLPSSSSTSEPRAPTHDITELSMQHSKSDDIKAKTHCDLHTAGPSGASSGARSLSVPSPATQASRKSGSASGKGPLVYKQVNKQGHGVKEPLKSGHRVNLAPAAAQPLLPLPVSPIQHKALFQMADRASRFNSMRRGRGRGGIGHAGRGGHFRPKVLDDFDFIAMNEKFKKEEVWEELLKVGTKERAGDGGDGLDVDYETREVGKASDENLLDIARKSVYVKDDFFDSLSCDALDKGQGGSERPKFLEQRKVDVETFGAFQVRSYRSGGGSHYRGKQGAGGGGRRGGGRGGGQARGGNRGRGHGFGFSNGSRGGDGRSGHVG